MWWQQVYVCALFSCLCCITSNQVFNITPLPDEACNRHNSCHTFQQILDSIPVHLDMSTTLNFLPGNHKISASWSLIIQDITALSMIAVSSNTKINCGNFVSFSFINISSVHIENLTFYGCGSSSFLATSAFQIQQLNSFVVCSSIFSHFEGRVIKAQQSNITINRSVIRHTNSLVELLTAHVSTITITDSNFTSNKARYNMIYTNNSEIKINRSSFTYNFVEYIGVLKVELSNLAINDTTIANNTASNWGILLIRRSTACLLYTSDAADE